MTKSSGQPDERSVATTLCRKLEPHAALLVAAAFVIGWAVVRACLQSITVDEADTFLGFAMPEWPSHWYPASGNHVLNSALVRLFTRIFGVSQLTVRIPALIGAAVYTAACIRLSVLLGSTRLLQLAVFVCLTFNPLVQDFLVASRGYSLALAFFTIVLAVLVRAITTQEISERGLVIASFCAGLSFCANFSFAFADAIALLALICRSWSVVKLSRGRLLAASLLPGLAVTFAICGYTLLHWPKGQLWFGAESLKEMCTGLIASSFYELNPFVVNPLLMSALSAAAQAIPPMAALLIVAQMAMAGRRTPAAPVLAAVILSTVGIHWISFRLFHLLLPKDRTALFFIPPLVLLLAALASNGAQGWAARALRKATVAVLALTAVYFIGCLRLAYFKEWIFDADTKALYFTLADLDRRQGAASVYVNWRYVASLNFYRAEYASTLGAFVSEPDVPAGRLVYVLDEPHQRSFIESQHLHVIYRGELSGAVVALRIAR